ncbi:3-ketosteroid-9-alpha-monooxygenase, ferredoxin reductase component [Paraburkholderia ultramafica]|uniref:3-ketosteroid-9-alpha-monooxygenase, ferredoxin reductase component n=1 Tax=Paraburkholderia ultramafica TaxID=1544867 RepID=A0A6S7CN13_9BURK|nr:hybrid-cluster NAD(P)-dependent oxidoreductase [Paraburkholderia ultramafica]CAB3793746.1 3-ketosteroid-9-alpha-monooxygenase, ferredoxin reductase component [Paraburkholderia ultramafica]
MNSVERVFDPVPDCFGAGSTWESFGKVWPSNQRQMLTCCRVIDETHDVKSFEFRTGDGLPVRFEPGQFLTVSTHVNGQTVERCYTISSPPTRPWLLSITVKRVPGGVMSNWLHDNMKPGSQLQAYGPSGAFTPTGAYATKSLYLSAGSGITPLMSMMRASIDLGLDRDVAFVHSARTPADIVFRDELHRLAALSPGLRLFFVCEGIGDEVAWRGPTGRLSLALLAKWIPDFAEREVYTCGPAGYMSVVRQMLREGGHDPARYHQESFDIGADLAQPASSVANAVSHQTYTVKLSRSARSFTMSATETVLGAAKKAGVAVPSSCSRGVCGTCKTKLLEGNVDMQHNGGIRDREVAKGFRLLCCSRATSDLVLEL